jgi:hypothetical protein
MVAGKCPISTQNELAADEKECARGWFYRAIIQQGPKTPVFSRLTGISLDF